MSYFKAKCVWVYDGDTITVRVGDKKEKVRLIGLDCAEKGKRLYWARNARAFTKRWCYRKIIYIETDIQERDKYGRLLGYVYKPFRKRGRTCPPSLRSGVSRRVKRYFLNKFLLLYGKAKLVIIPPNTKYASSLTSAYIWAREHKMGLWRNKN